MGSITKRNDSKKGITFQVRIRKLGYPEVSRTFRTKSEARIWMVETEDQMDNPVSDIAEDAKKYTLGYVLERYRDEVAIHKKGIEQETIRINAMLRDKMMGYSLSHITSSLIADWRNRRLQCVAGATVNRELAILHHAIEVARKEWGIGLPINPVSDVSRAKQAPGRTRRLSRAEYSALVEGAAHSLNDYILDIIHLAIETAMRRSEIVGLRWELIDLHKRVAHLLDTKNGTNRSVPLSGRAIEVLTSIKQRRGSICKEGRVFPNLTGSAV